VTELNFTNRKQNQISPYPFLSSRVGVLASSSAPFGPTTGSGCLGFPVEPKKEVRGLPPTNGTPKVRTRHSQGWRSSEHVENRNSCIHAAYVNHGAAVLQTDLFAVGANKKRARRQVSHLLRCPCEVCNDTGRVRAKRG
jgi:hypothetical protein